MKKVFLSLAVIAALTVVSCKQAEAPAEDAAAVVDSAAVVVDSAAAVRTVDDCLSDCPVAVVRWRRLLHGRPDGRREPRRAHPAHPDRHAADGQDRRPRIALT